MERIYSDDVVILPEKLEIPEISDKRLEGFYAFLKPIVTIDEMKYLLREFALNELRNTTFLFDVEKNLGERVEADKLAIVEEFLCLHRDYNLKYFQFKPTIAEVLAQAPYKTLREADYFEIVAEPKTNSDRVRYPELFKRDFVLSKVRTYKNISQ